MSVQVVTGPGSGPERAAPTVPGLTRDLQPGARA